MMAMFFFIAHEKGFTFHAQPQTGAYSCSRSVEAILGLLRGTKAQFEEFVVELNLACAQYGILKV